MSCSIYNRGQNLEKVMTSSPKFTFRPRTRPITQQGTPGPGAYSVDTHNHFKFERSQNYGFGTASRSGPVCSHRPSPGPGTYEPPASGETRTLPQASPKWKIGSSERMHSPHTAKCRLTPGPGAYETHETVGENKIQEKGPQWGFGTQKKSPSAQHRDVPGPGAYNPPRQACSNDVRNAGPHWAPPHWSFGSEQRMHSPHEHVRKTPGPGLYNNHVHGTVGDDKIKERGPQWRFGSQQKLYYPHQHAKATPGPGAYGDTFTLFGH